MNEIEFDIKGRLIKGNPTDVMVMGKWKKKPIPIEVFQVKKPFTVTTLEGKDHRGKTGDYLLIGIRGEAYCCDKEIFEESYEKVKPNHKQLE